MVLEEEEMKRVKKPGHFFTKEMISLYEFIIHLMADPKCSDRLTNIVRLRG